jgi:RNA polymerase sigma-70 factor, ECF subfamily
VTEDALHTNIVKGNESRSESALVAAAKGGDRFAFECLIIPLQSRLLRWLTHLSGDRAIAEEVLQESLFKAYVSLATFREDASFATWLSRIAKNTYFAWHKNHLRRPDNIMLDDGMEDTLSDDTIWPTSVATPETNLWQQELAQAITKAMAELPATWGEALKLREEEGLSYEEIAQIQGVAIGTIRSRIHRARERLAEVLHSVMEPA